MPSEGAQSVSSSMKRGFCAPLIKKDAVREFTNTQTSGKKAVPKNKKDAGGEATTPTTGKKMVVKAGGEKTATHSSGKKCEVKKLSIEEKNDSGGEKTTNQNYDKGREAKTKNDSGGEKSTNQNYEKKREAKTKPQTSLTDSQYEDIFQSVLQGTTRQNNTSRENISTNSHNETENTPSCNEQENNLCNEQVNTPSYDIKAGPKRSAPEGDMTETPPIKRSKSQSEASPWGSHFSKHLSEASSIIKDMVESQNSLMNSSALLSPETSSGEGEDEGGQWSQRSCQLSQQSLGSYDSQPRPKDVTNDAPEDQRSRLENLQRLRNVGLWVYCCRLSCQKQRYLADVTDPQDVPEIWYCHMNPDVKYNSCLKPEQTLSAEEEADMIYNEFTAGSVVWARVQGYPWWPAMVDDDPDLEQFYWLLEDDVTVTHYHVVFFDDGEVTRAWVSLKDISPFSKNENKYKQKSARGIDYSRRLRVSREQARRALTMSTSQRLSAYSFIARYNGPISTSAKKAKDTMTKYKLKRITPKITNGEELKTQAPKKDIEKKVSKPRAKDFKKASKTKPREKSEVGLNLKNTKRHNKKKGEQTGNGTKKHLDNVEERQSTMEMSGPKKSTEENIAKEFEEVEDDQLSYNPFMNKKLKPSMFEKYSMKKSQKSSNIDARKASQASLKNSNLIETISLEEENKKVIDEKIALNEPIDKMQNTSSSDQLNAIIDAEVDLTNGHQTHPAIEKEHPAEELVMMVDGEKSHQDEGFVMNFNGEKEPQVEDSVMKFEKKEHQVKDSVRKSNREKSPQVEDSVMKFIEEKDPKLNDSLMTFDEEKEHKPNDSFMKFDEEKEIRLNDSVMMFDEEKEPQLEDSVTMFDSETPSHIDVNSQKSKSSDRGLKPPEVEEETPGSMIEPTENLVAAPPNSQVFSSEDYSQSTIAGLQTTIANYMGLESEDEDAVVPYFAFDQSQPFEE